MSTERDWPDGVPGSVSCPRFRRDEKPTGAQLSSDAGPMGSMKAFRFSVREIRGPAPPDEAWSLRGYSPGATRSNGRRPARRAEARSLRRRRDRLARSRLTSATRWDVAPSDACAPQLPSERPAGPRGGHAGELRSRGQRRQRSCQSWPEAKKWRRRRRRQPGSPALQTGFGSSMNSHSSPNSRASRSASACTPRRSVA